MSLDLATRDGVAILTIDGQKAMNALNFSLLFIVRMYNKILINAKNVYSFLKEKNI